MRTSIQRLTIVALTFFAACLLAQESDEVPIRTTVCEVVNAPKDFDGKLIEIRAELWGTGDNAWINDSIAGLREFGKSCQWLEAEFTYPTSLVASSAFGTFIGRVSYEPSNRLGQSAKVTFMIERHSNISHEQVLNGPIARPMRFDTKTQRFLLPAAR